MIDFQSNKQLSTVLSLLEKRLRLNRKEPVRLVVCGGASLIATRLVSRPTKDVDVVALMDEDQQLLDPEPLPPALLEATKQVADDLGLADNWLNNGPSRGQGGLFQMGLPEGFADRLQERKYGSHLTVYYTARIDQIFFKLYAAVDRGGYHIEDLQALSPSPIELEMAAQWSMTHDVSEGFRSILKRLLKQIDHESVAEKL